MEGVYHLQIMGMLQAPTLGMFGYPDVLPHDGLQEVWGKVLVALNCSPPATLAIMPLRATCIRSGTTQVMLLAEDGELRRKIGMAGSRRIRELFDSRKLAAQLEGFYDGLLNEETRAAPQLLP